MQLILPLGSVDPSAPAATRRAFTQWFQLFVNRNIMLLYQYETGDAGMHIDPRTDFLVPANR